MTKAANIAAVPLMFAAFAAGWLWETIAIGFGAGRELRFKQSTRNRRGLL